MGAMPSGSYWLVLAESGRADSAKRKAKTGVRTLLTTRISKKQFLAEILRVLTV
jgi:hypothetical protein